MSALGGVVGRRPVREPDDDDGQQEQRRRDAPAFALEGGPLTHEAHDESDARADDRRTRSTHAGPAVRRARYAKSPG